MCCVEGNVYLVGGYDFERVVTKYNSLKNKWENMPSLQRSRYGASASVCTLDNKIFVLGGYCSGTTCEMLDLRDDDPHWTYVARMNSVHFGGGVVIERKIYVLGGNTTVVEVYDADQGILMKYLQMIIFDIYRSVEQSNQHAN